MKENLEVICQSSVYSRLCRTLEEGVRPQSVIIKANPDLHEACALLFSRVFLAGTDQLKDICKDILDKSQIVSPDVILSGDPGVAPGIDRCREISRELMVRPVESRGRVAIIFSADKLSLPASNSLLKIAEEPPDGAVIIFLSSIEGELIPTLTSRSWSFSISTVRKRDQLALPSGEQSWVKWLSGNDKRDVNDLLTDLECWIDEALGKEDQLLAGKIESLKIMGAKKKLPKTMFQDLILLVIKEGIPFEHIPGDFW